MKKIFISYSHKDEKWKDRLKTHLDALSLEGDLHSWDDREIKPGDPWFQEIETALNQASAVILLISANFLSSPFIRSEEIPRILERRENEGIGVFPLLVSDCSWERISWLKVIQMAPRDGKPLDKCRKSTVNTHLTKLAGQIADFLDTAPAGTAKPKYSGLMENSVFVGRDKELTQMAGVLHSGKGSAQVITGRLFSIAGAGGVGKTMLANEAAKRYGDQFPDGVFRIRVDEYTPIAFANHLAGLLGTKISEPKDNEAARGAVSGLLKNRRLLLILDNAVDWSELKYQLPCETGSAILVTTRNREIYNHVRLECRGLAVSEIPVETFTRPEVAAFFKEMLEKEYREADKAIHLRIAESLGFLPLALRQAAALMVFAPRYSASQLVEKLEQDDRLDLLRKGAVVEESTGRALDVVFEMSSPHLEAGWLEALQYLAVCSPGPVPLDFLEQLSGCGDMLERMEGLYSRSWCSGSEEDGKRSYELHPLVRELIKKRYGDPFRVDFIGLVHKIFTDKEVHFSVKDRYFLQLEEAFLLAREDGDPRLKYWLYELPHFCVYRGYGDFYIRLTEGAEELFPGDDRTLRAVYGHRASIQYLRGNLDEALELYKKQEKIENKLKNKAGLSACYGNQALILRSRGQLDEALALFKEQESICKQLGDRAGLSITYGNQALILRARGQLDDALALHKKEESICKQLGDRAGLSRTYGNQALILSARGQLDEALALHKKAEKIKEQLGDRAGLAICWWNMGNVYGDKNDTNTQRRLWEKSIQTNKEIGIPCEKLEKALNNLTEMQS